MSKDNKISVTRHRKLSKSSAHRCEKTIETRTRREAIVEAIAEYDRVLAVFWSPIPIGHTHQRYVDGKKELERQLAELDKSQCTS